jgi:hypothetical protein
LTVKLIIVTDYGNQYQLDLYLNIVALSTDNTNNFEKHDYEEYCKFINGYFMLA